MEIKNGDDCYITALPYALFNYYGNYVWDLNRVFPNSKPLLHPGQMDHAFRHYKGFSHFSPEMTETEAEWYIKKYFGCNVTLWANIDSLFLPGTEKAMRNIVYSVDSNIYTPLFAEMKEDVHFVQFLPQNVQYYYDIMDEIRHELEIAPITDDEPNSKNNRRALENIKSSNSAALHIRFMDNSAAGQPQRVDRIRALIEHMKELANNPQFFVFSNYPETAKALLADCGSSFTYINSNNGKWYFRDFQLMRECNHFILTNNSSFGFYAALMGKKTGENDKSIILLDENNKNMLMSWGKGN